MKSTYFSLQSVIVLDLIRQGSSNLPVSMDHLKDRLFNVSRREIKIIIRQLREFYPIVSRSEKPNGYWIARDEAEIDAFVKRMNANILGYERMLDQMLVHKESGTYHD